MTDISEDGRVRRTNIRRLRGGARFSGRGSDNLGTPRDFDDDVEEAIDPMRVSTNIAARAQYEPRPPEGDDGPSPAARLHDVTNRASPAYTKEYRLKLVGRMVMMGIPLDKIAEQLRVSISTVEKDRAAWRKMLAEQARGFDVNEYLGGQMAFYDEVTGQAMQIAATARGENAVPTAMRLAAMRTAIASQNDKTRTLQSGGVFEAARFRRSADGTAMSDVQTLMAQTMEALNDLLQADEPPTPRRPGPGPSRGRPRAEQGHTFEQMDMTSNDDQELLEL